MSQEPETELPANLEERSAEIAAHWHRALSGTCYVPLDAAEVRKRLAGLAREALFILESEATDVERGKEIGRALAGLHYVVPEACGRTMGVLAGRLTEGLGAEQTIALQPRLAALLQAVSTGFCQEANRAILAEQDTIRTALVVALRDTEQALRQAQGELEARVAKRTAEARAAEERWRLLVQNAPDLVITLSRDQRILFMNRTPDGADVTEENLVGNVVTDFVLPDYRDMVQGAIVHVVETGEGTQYDLPVARKGGTIVWYETRLAPLHEDGQVAGVLLLSRNITERKKLADLKDNLIRDVSHELRTPLAKMQMGLDLLLEVLGNEPVERDRALQIADMAARSSGRLLTTVEAILDLSALEAGGAIQDPETIPPRELIEDAILDMQSFALAKGLMLVADVPDALPPVQGSREQLHRLLTNLVDNAIKFSDKGEILLSVRAAGDMVEFAVQDTGEGILPANLDRVFERFFQEKTRYHGVGVGLAICKGIVQAHGGKIWAESPGRDQGTTLRFLLPVNQEAAREKEWPSGS